MKKIVIGFLLGAVITSTIGCETDNKLKENHNEVTTEESTDIGDTQATEGVEDLPVPVDQIEEQ